MALVDLMFIVNAFSVMLALVSLVYISRLREFEVREVESSINAVVFGIFFLFIILLINTLKSLDAAIHDQLVSIIPNISVYINYLVQINELALAPLLAVCFLIGIFLLRENA